MQRIVGLINKEIPHRITALRGIEHAFCFNKKSINGLAHQAHPKATKDVLGQVTNLKVLSVFSKHDFMCVLDLHSMFS